MNEFFQMLKKDHAEVKGILRQLKETKEKWLIPLSMIINLTLELFYEYGRKTYAGATSPDR